MLIQFKTKQNLGFTLYELFIVLGIVLVVTLLAVPSMGRMIIESDLKDAEATVVKALRIAKNMARVQNQSIIVRFTKDSQSIQLEKKDGSITTIGKLPKKTQLLADDQYIYSPFGTINSLGEIDIQSTVDNTKTKKVSIVSLIGQLSNG